MNASLLFLALMLASPIVGCTTTPTDGRTAVKSLKGSVASLPIEGELPSFGTTGVWLNSPPLTPADLRGKVVLVDFWTYSCINWIRQAPYVRAWADKYKDHGLVVIGVHSPEFGFESDVERVRHAVQAMDLMYPVVTDNGHPIWRAFENEAWPALFFVDAKGHIRHRHYGEGAYDQSEEILQQLLAEAGSGEASQPLLSIEPKGVEAQADWRSLKSPENYVGFARTENFASPEGPARDRRRAYSAPARLALNHWALVGEWTMGGEATAPNAAHARIVYRFHARDLHLVMGPQTPGASVQFRVLLDGRPPESAHGLDVDAEGYGVVTEYRLYQLIRQSGSIVDRTFEVEFFGTGVETFSFTFG